MKGYCIRIPDEIIKEIDALYIGHDISTKIRECLIDRITQGDNLKLRIELLKAQLKVLEDAYNSNILVGRKKISPDMKKWLLQTIDIITKDSHFEYGRYRAFQNQFHQQLTFNDFKLLLKEVKDELVNRENNNTI